jgi:pimeloyl-ACP methyl ester carboxylesterase
MPHVEIDGTRFFYQQSGSGPDVVLVHAVTSNLAVWMFTGIVDELARDFRVTVYDLRGHGQSDCPPAGYTSADMARDFEHLHNALELGPAFLVGHSFGGGGGTHAAANDPKRVRGIILSDSFFPGLEHVEPNFGRTTVWEDLRETFRAVGANLPEALDFEQLFRTIADLTPEQNARLDKALGPFSKGWMRQLPRLAGTTCGRDVMEEAGLTAQRIASLRQPVTALYDEFSPFLATCRWLETNLANCQVEIIPAAKHLALVQNPGVFNDAVRRHLLRMQAMNV